MNHEKGDEFASEDPKIAALEAFERWSNYLLVATVAAIGWVASKNVVFRYAVMQSLTLWLLGVSIIFGVLTLALVPLIAQAMRDKDSTSKPSVYSIQVSFKIFRISGHVYLTQACRPQHVAFMLGIICYCFGVVDIGWIGIVVAITFSFYGFFSKPG
ncbi:hypothetical protein AB0L41_36170 [Amycolatopsis mediterranei]|uniref:hypothetical protein n=1 Tax=Amycolatopsis mediterranei TaxID=33910 RepID=UPI0034285FDD